MNLIHEPGVSDQVHFAYENFFHRLKMDTTDDH